jgi:hypothetical protein
MNIMMNNRSKDWYAELGKYINETIDISKVPELVYYAQERPKNIVTKIKDFLSNDSRFYFGISSMFITSVLDENNLRKMFGEPLFHSEFGEGFDGEWNEEECEYGEPEIKEDYASYFVNVGGTEFHIGYDHRGTKVEIGLDKEFDRKPSDEQAQKCLNSLKGLVDLFKDKI